MRIALLTGEYPPQPGGIGDYTERLGTALVARGHAVYVFTIAEGRFWVLDLGAGKTRSQVVFARSGWGWRSWQAVQTAIEHTNPDMLHIQYQTGAYAMRPAINLLPARLAWQRQRPLVAVTAHDLLLPYLFPKAGLLRRWVTKRLLADADAVVVTNQDDLAQATLARPRALGLIPIGSNIAAAAPPGYDRAAWRASLGVGDDQTLVVFFGLISRSKGLDVLLDALAQLPEHVRLLVVGGAASAPVDRAYAAQIERRIVEQRLAARVTITGYCPTELVPAHLLAADLVALPFDDGASFRRGSLLAALAHGLPTITTTPQAEDKRLADGENVLLVPPGDQQALAGAVVRLAQDAQLRARLARGGQALAGQFAWPAIAQQHEALYARLAARSAR